MSVIKKSKKSKANKKSRRIISFEEEIVTRNEAEKYLGKKSLRKSEMKPECISSQTIDDEVKNNETQQIKVENGHNTSETLEFQKKKKHKKREKCNAGNGVKDILDNEPCEGPKEKEKRKHILKTESNQEPLEADVSLDDFTDKKKRKKGKKRNKDLGSGSTTSFNNDNTSTMESENIPLKKSRKQDTDSKVENTETESSNNTEDVRPKEESKRHQKRTKHLKLLEGKKMKMELMMNQKALEYLSKWKHSHDTWKFEKLRQIWLQQHLFDSTKLPSKFWDTTVEYFTNAKGQVKTVLIEKAVKIIEKSNPAESNEDDIDTNDKEEDNDEEAIRLKRARDIVQYLQEE